ncbi:MAG: UDP-N-acetylglucosamine 2-epimerase (non-hydrolyzing) [bacterium]|nr:UDP-N-acetylglucosamine 2-epimerase (non-hydrolyzing) [bacterium]
MKIMTVLGTRPEIIRLCLIIGKLDKLCRHVLVHTGQNYDPGLKDVFFRDLKVREPDYYLNARGTFGEQTGMIFREVEKVILREKPDRLLILGDTNSGLAGVIAKRHGIPVFHMEAGNRCYDDRVPEEVNRRIIDHSSDILMPYTQRSRENLLAEGIPGRRIYVTGNPIKEVIDTFAEQVEASPAPDRLTLEKGKYFLVTLHRAENVDVRERLERFIDALNRLHREYGNPVVCSLHPRTRERIKQYAVDTGNITFLEPLPFFDFLKLEKNAGCVLSDSGTVQEECCIFKVPSVTLRDTTERPETIEVGSNILSGSDPGRILDCVKLVSAKATQWEPPEEYLVENVSDTVLNILLGYHPSIKENNK